MRLLRLLLPDGELAQVTARCLQDYIDQVRPALEGSLEAAFKDMQRLVNQHGELGLERPVWMAPPAEGAPEWGGVPRWLVAGDVAVLIQYAASDPDALLACAVVTRGSVSGEVRRIRSEKGAGRRRYRRSTRKDGTNKQRARFRRERRDREARESDSRRDEA